MKKSLDFSEKRNKHIFKNNSKLLCESENSLNERSNSTNKSINKKLLNTNKSIGKSRILNKNKILNKKENKNITKKKSGNHIYNKYNKNKEKNSN